MNSDSSWTPWSVACDVGQGQRGSTVRTPSRPACWRWTQACQAGLGSYLKSGGNLEHWWDRPICCGKQHNTKQRNQAWLRDWSPASVPDGVSLGTQSALSGLWVMQWRVGCPFVVSWQRCWAGWWWFPLPLHILDTRALNPVGTCSLSVSS